MSDSDSETPKRILGLAIVDGVSGLKAQELFDEITDDTPDEVILRAIKSMRESAPRIDNVIPFPLNEQR